MLLSTKSFQGLKKVQNNLKSIDRLFKTALLLSVLFVPNMRVAECLDMLINSVPAGLPACAKVTHIVAAPLFQHWAGWPGSHHKHNEREDLAGQSGILMIHMFISYLPTSTPTPDSFQSPFLSAPFNKRDVCLVLKQRALLCASSTHATQCGSR